MHVISTTQYTRLRVPMALPRTVRGSDSALCERLCAVLVWKTQKKRRLAAKTGQTRLTSFGRNGMRGGGEMGTTWLGGGGQ